MRGYVFRRMGRIEEAVRYFIRSAETFPRSSWIKSDVADTYSLLRMPDSAIYYYDLAIRLRPDVADNYISKANIYFNLKGDIVTGKQVLKEGVLFANPKEFTDEYTYVAMLDGKYTEAIQWLKDRNDTFYSLSQNSAILNAMLIAIMLKNQGKQAEARLYFQKAMDILQPWLSQSPEDYRIHSALGIAYAGLGERTKSIEEGNRARDLMPLSRDALIGVSQLENLALIHVLIGEEDEAIDILTQLLKMPHGWTITNTIPLYRTFPYWKPLLSNPRFQALLK